MKKRAVAVEPVARSYDVELPEAGRVTVACASWAGEGDLRLLLVHGLSHNRRVWAPMVEALLETHGAVIREIVAMDLPGHGDSTTPEGDLPFGRLTLDHYAAAVRGAIDGLRTDDGRGFDGLVGHSMGGITLLVLAQALKEAGSGLAALGVRGVALVAPTMPEQVPWAFAEGLLTPEGLVSPLLLTLLPYVRYRPSLGFHAAMSATEYLGLFFTRPDGALALGAPTDAQAEALKELEAYAAAAQLGGIDLRGRQPLERPHADQGLLQGHAYLHVAYAADVFMTVAEQEHLADWLQPGARVVEDGDGDAVHCALWSRPAYTAGAVGGWLEIISNQRIWGRPRP